MTLSSVSAMVSLCDSAAISRQSRAWASNRCAIWEGSVILVFFGKQWTAALSEINGRRYQPQSAGVAGNTRLSR